MDPIEIAKVTPNPSHTQTELKEVLFSHSQSVHSLTPKIPGVYFLFSGKKIVYVGQSTHVPGRIATHVLERKINFDRVAYLSISPNELLLEESRYISMFKPKYNRTGIYDKERGDNESKNSTTIVMKVSANKFRFSDANIGKIPRSEIRMKLGDSETELRQCPGSRKRSRFFKKPGERVVQKKSLVRSSCQNKSALGNGNRPVHKGTGRQTIEKHSAQDV